MKFSLMLLGSLALSCSSAYTQKHESKRVMNLTEDCYHNGHLSPWQRRHIYPFNRAASVEVISFKGVYDYDFGEVTDVMEMIDAIEDTLALPGDHQYQPQKPDTIERVVLTDAQIDALTDILYNYNFHKKLNHWTSNVSYWMPRQSILWRDGNGKIFGSLEICFVTGETYSTLPEGTYGEFCTGKFEMLRAYFVGLGITYFEE